MAKISLACFSPKRKQQSVVLEGIQGQTHPRALGAIKADDHIRPRRRQPTPFSYPVVPKRHVELIPSVLIAYKDSVHHRFSTGRAARTYDPGERLLHQSNNWIGDHQQTDLLWGLACWLPFSH